MEQRIQQTAFPCRRVLLQLVYAEESNTLEVNCGLDSESEERHEGAGNGRKFFARRAPGREVHQPIRAGAQAFLGIGWKARKTGAGLRFGPEPQRVSEPIFYHSISGTPFVWDKYLPAGTIQKDADGLWHVGEGTDLSEALFEFNLTKADHKFLKAVRIEK